MRFRHFASLLRSSAAGLLLTAAGSLACAQANVDALRSRLVGQPLVIRIEGIRMTHAVLFNKLDIRVVDGVVQNRLMKSQLDTDEVMHPGDRVRVTKVDTSTDRSHDYLRVTVAAADGLTVPVAFVFSKGQLATASDTGLEQALETAFAPNGGRAPLPGPGVPPSPAAHPATPPSDLPMPPTDPVPPETVSAPGHPAAAGTPVGGGSWRPGKVMDGGKAAEVAGKASFHGQAGPALLALSCGTVEVRVRKTMAPQADSLNCDFDTDSGNLAVKFAVGSHPEEVGGICYESKETNPSVVTLPIDLGAGGLEEILASPGTSLNLRVQFSDGGGDDLKAIFQMPQDASMLTFLRSCAKTPSASETANGAQPLLSCPTLPGKGLRHADVIGAGGKPYTGMDGDNDIGAVWNLPPITKAHPARQKLTLACSYGTGLKGPAAGTKETLEVKLFPIPAAAKTCVSRGSAELGEAYAICSK